MIECIFTIDYEIYGNGQGSLRDLVYSPAASLVDVFNKWNSKFVAFVEVAELERIEEAGTDEAIADVRRQVASLYRDGFEIALHLHPQWYNAQWIDGNWSLDYSEYNLCTLTPQRIESIVTRSLGYLRDVLGTSNYTPRAFRAGNWLFQPSKTATAVLAKAGVKIDSSVFKGGLQSRHGLDYRPALKNSYFWRFQDDVNAPDPRGEMLEIPIYSRMVPFWKMMTTKRVALQRKSNLQRPNGYSKFKRLRDYLRPTYPLKFDFCRMTLDEAVGMLRKVLTEDRRTPNVYRPVVAIGHTKDLDDLATVDSLLAYLHAEKIKVATFEGANAHTAQR